MAKTTTVRQGLTSFASDKVGLPYVWGGTTDAGYDCSGLIYKAYESQGISIPRVAQDQYNASTKVATQNLKPGDSVFFSDTGSTSNVTHTGMYIGNGQYIHAANRGDGIIVSTLPTGGSYFVGGGTFAGADGANGVKYSGNSANLNAALNSLKGGSGGSSGVPTGSQNVQIYSPNLQAALNSIGGGFTVSDGSAVQLYNENGGMSYGGNVIDYITEQLSVKDKILKVIGHILKFITLLMIFALSAVLFFKAFNMRTPGLNMIGGKQ